MAGYRMGRVTEDIRRELMAIVRELKDPRVDPVLLTVVRAEVAHDLSYCKAYVSSLNGIENAKEACKVLNGSEIAVRGLFSELGDYVVTIGVPWTDRSLFVQGAVLYLATALGLKRGLNLE